VLDEWLPFKVTKVFRGLTGRVPAFEPNALTGLGLVSSNWVWDLLRREFRLPESEVSVRNRHARLRASTLLKPADGCNPVWLC